MIHFDCEMLLLFQWLDRTKRKSLLAALEKIKEGEGCDECLILFVVFGLIWFLICEQN